MIAPHLNKMIAAASYNVFNGEELLAASIKSVRNQVDHINLVVQFVSNTGAPAHPRLKDILSSLQSDRLVDEVQIYEPDLTLPAWKNEIQKRSIGLEISKKHGATHFMTMDCDEFYLENEFSRAKSFILENDIEACSAPTFLHIKRPIWRSKKPDTTEVSFLSKIDNHSRLIYNDKFPANVDPTRRINGNTKRFYRFDRTIIAMRHMNLVRDNFLGKLQNSSNHDNKIFMNEVEKMYSEWRFGRPLIFPNKPAMKIIEVPDHFSIDSQFHFDRETSDDFDQPPLTTTEKFRRWFSFWH